MENLEYKLTVDDLIVEYMLYKVTNGYEPNFYTKEFIEFLHFFESKMKVEDSLYDGEKLFNRFFDRKFEREWTIMKDHHTGKREIRTRMEMDYREENKNFIIRANYYLCGDDSKLGYYCFKNKVAKMESIMHEFLLHQPKRKIDETTQLDEQDLTIGKYIAAEMITQIWDSTIDKHIDNHMWPYQCKDINQYLFDIDLAEIIGVKSMKNDLIEIYSVFAKRLAILYKQDRNLKMTSYHSCCLAKANYDLLIQGYENIMKMTFDFYTTKSFDIDLSKSIVTESHEIAGVYYEDDDPDIKTTILSIGNDSTKKLVKTIEKTISNN